MQIDHVNSYPAILGGLCSILLWPHFFLLGSYERCVFINLENGVAYSLSGALAGKLAGRHLYKYSL